MNHRRALGNHYNLTVLTLLHCDPRATTPTFSSSLQPSLLLTLQRSDVDILLCWAIGFLSRELLLLVFLLHAESHVWDVYVVIQLIPHNAQTNAVLIPQVTSALKSPVEQLVWKRASGLRATSPAAPQLFVTVSWSRFRKVSLLRQNNPPDLRLDLTASSWLVWVTAGLRCPLSLHHSTNWILPMLHILAASPLSSLSRRKPKRRACFQSFRSKRKCWSVLAESVRSSLWTQTIQVIFTNNHNL